MKYAINFSAFAALRRINDAMHSFGFPEKIGTNVTIKFTADWKEEPTNEDALSIAKIYEGVETGDIQYLNVTPISIERMF